MRQLAGLVSIVGAAALSACGNAAPLDDVEIAGTPAGVLTIEPAALATRLQSGESIQLIDVRTPEEFAEGHLAGALNIPLGEFNPDRLPETKGAVRILYCRSDRRSGIAAARLAAASGENATHLEGGIVAWEDRSFSVSR